ncbi:MAG: helicase-exonuclease AddAB subunit AddA [Lachnospiraceae bacterium]|nr:helicase-exonuclease AddAB subunit AddA [Lachnospiraceae bacterium]
MEFTKDQQNIIEARGCSLIVSAAAGSGKTAVLVERIIGLITDPKDPVDIDTLLVLTFTNAAAAQMKDKIRNAILDKLDKNPEDDNLHRQAALVHNARITTIDSFCQYVLKNSFADIDVDPAFRVAEDGENKLLEADVLEALIEEGFGSGDEDLMKVAEHFASGSSDDAIFSAITSIYRVADSDPWPYEWLRSHMNDYSLPEGSALPDEIMDYIRNTVMSSVTTAVSMYDRAVNMCESGGLHPDYTAMYLTEREALEKLHERLDSEPEAGLDDIAAMFEDVTFPTLSRKKNPDEDKEARDMAKALRDTCKSLIGDIRDTYLSTSEKDAVTYIRECSETVSALCLLTIKYMDALRRERDERGILSFSDIEHFALDILVERGEDGLPVFTDAAAEYRSHFSYVFTDEYQDSNMIQELILSAVSGESEGRYNRFMVGDVKQSIYRFRQAEPEIFMEKYGLYEYESKTERKVDLNKNFRSRRQVLDSCNALFERVMSVESGGADYDERASLKYGADYPDLGSEEESFRTELIFTNSKDPDITDASDAEGETIARRIEELIESGLPVYDSEKKLTRPVRYGDIVILYRSNGYAAETYKRVLEAHSIPVALTGSSGYFDTYEISTLMNMLRIIVNPLQDIPFYGTMESVIGGFSPEECARISSAYSASLPKGVYTGEGYLYSACRYAASDAADAISGELRGRVKSFIDSLERYRKMSGYMGVSELLSLILRDTGYRVLMLAMPGGKRRVANVDVLINKADDYAGTSYFGLYNFIRYIDTMGKSGAGEEEAETPDEAGDCVRIMTIHKSKGLEFPVVIVARMGNKFNMQDSQGMLVCDHRCGIGLNNFDPARRIRYRNLMHKYVADRIRSQSLAEEMRILYVAMTRAKEKLIMMCTLKADGADEETGEILVKCPAGNNRYIDWQLKCICDVLDSDAFCVSTNPVLIPELAVTIQKSDISAESAEESGVVSAVNADLLRQNLEGMSPDGEDTRAFRDYLKRLYGFEYPHTDLSGLYSKTSVSVLKHAAMPEDAERAFEMYKADADDEKDAGFPDAPVPRFISGTSDRPGATARGSAFHRMLELYDFLSDRDLQAQIDANADDGRLAAEERHILDNARDVKLIRDFLDSDTAARMAAAQQKGLLFREAPFMMGIPASSVDERYPEEETVLIQGIIDVYWIEDGEAVILDYKTDRVKSAERLVELYKTQLDYYEAALNRMHIPVKEKLIYSFALGETITL